MADLIRNPSTRVDSIFEYLEVVARLQQGGLRLWFRGVASLEYELVPGLIWMNEQQWEGNYVHHFLVSYRSYVDTPLHNPWDLYGLMQHHGLPTRLLDWSKSPLHALFFALTQEPESDCERVVWVLPPYRLNERTLGLESVFCPGVMASRSIRLGENRLIDLDAYLPEALDPHDHYALPEHPIAIEAPLSHRRLRGQMGCFTVHGSSAESLDSYFAHSDEAPYLAQIVLNTSGRRNEFLDPLLSWGINEEVVYQDLDSLAARIRREQGQ